jgi:F-type H+-transporting ATPase subunit b
MPLGIDFMQIFLHLFNVILLFGGLYILLYAPVKKFMKQREEHYKELEEKAQASLQEAEELKHSYEEKLKGVQEEIAAQKKKAAAELDKERQMGTRDVKEEAARIIADAKRDAEKKRSAILEDAKQEISKMIVDATEKLMLESVDGSVYDAFLDNVERSTVNGGE